LQDARHWLLVPHWVWQSAAQFAPQAPEQLKLPGLASHWVTQLFEQTVTSSSSTVCVHCGAQLTVRSAAQETSMRGAVHMVSQLTPGGCTSH
jgi:hypothetical protein